MQHYWFGDVEEGRCTPGGREIKERIARHFSLQREVRMDGFQPLSVKEACECMGMTGREEYLTELRALTMALAEGRIEEFSRGRDQELLQMVRMLDEMDHVINLLTERATEWYRVRHPGMSGKSSPRGAKRMLTRICQDRSKPLAQMGGEISRLSSSRTALMKEVSRRADSVLPNMSALVGGLVAARLLSQAGGLEALAAFPASAIQVLGAKNALFTHIKTGSPPPKHGVIFQHRRVHNADPSCRGKVSRVLAGTLAIAARIDCYRGELAPEYIQKAQERIDRAGEGR